MHIEDRCAASFAAELLDRLPYLVERTEAVVSTDVGTENWDALDEVLTYFAKELAGESTEPTEAP